MIKTTVVYLCEGRYYEYMSSGCKSDYSNK